MSSLNSSKVLNNHQNTNRVGINTIGVTSLVSPRQNGIPAQTSINLQNSGFFQNQRYLSTSPSKIEAQIITNSQTGQQLAKSIPIMGSQVLVQGQNPQQIILNRQMKSSQQVILQEKVVQQPVFVERRVLVENNEQIEILQKEISDLQVKLRQEIQNHQQTLKKKPQQVQIEKVIEKPVYYQKETVKEVEVPVEKKIYIEKEKLVEKPVYIEKEVEKIKYVDQPIYKEKIVYIEDEKKKKLLEDQIDYWRKQADEWRAKYYLLENEEVTFKVVKSKVSQNGRLNGELVKTSVNFSNQDSRIITQNQNNNNNLRSSGILKTHQNQQVYDRNSYRSSSKSKIDNNQYIPPIKKMSSNNTQYQVYVKQNSAYQSQYIQRGTSLQSSQVLKNSQTMK